MRFLKPSTGHISLTDPGQSQDRMLKQTFDYAKPFHGQDGSGNGTQMTQLSINFSFRRDTHTWEGPYTYAVGDLGWTVYIWQGTTDGPIAIFCWAYDRADYQTSKGVWNETKGCHVTPDSWCHVGITCDGTQSTIANIWTCTIDGVECNNGSCSGNVIDDIRSFPGYGLTMGTRYVFSSSYTHNSDYSELSLWNTALTAAQHRELMTRRPARGEQGLVGYWPLANDYRDRSGYGNDFEPFFSGYPPLHTRSNTKEKRCVVMAQTWSNQINALRHTDDAAFEISGDLTIEFWWARNEYNTVYRNFCFGKSGASGNMVANNMSYEICCKGISGGMQFEARACDGTNTALKYQWLHGAGQPVCPRRKENCDWTHVAFVFDISQSTPATQWTIYIDGSVQGQQHIGSGDAVAVSPGIEDLDDQLTLGNWDADSDYWLWSWNGKFAEIRLWNKTRTSGEVNANYNSSITAQSGLVGYWPGHPDASGNLEDMSGNGNDLVPDNTTEISFGPGHPFKE